MRECFMEKDLSRYKALETMCLLAAAAICFSILFRTQVFLYIALAFLVTGTFLTGLTEIISRGWLTFANVLGTINSRIILSIIFFLFVTPVALFYRLLHGDFMDIRKDPTRKTYYKARDHVYSAGDLEKPW